MKNKTQNPEKVQEVLHFMCSSFDSIIELAKEKYATADPEVRASLERAFGNLVKPEPQQKKNITDGINGIEDVFRELGRDYNQFLKDHEAKGTPIDKVGEEELEIGIAYLNQGWKMDYTKKSAIGYWPWHYVYHTASGPRLSYLVWASTFSYANATSDASTHVGLRLLLCSSELAKFAGEKFLKSYEKYKLGV